ncbi:MAG: DUF2341 domain-containing protein, partial [Actinobacteria bacterium]|nr:DUF2341 domain-containing protein [Actinomycetota bacterium]
MPPRVAAALFILVLWTACSVERSAIAPGSGGEDTGVSSMDARPDSVPDAPATDAVVPRDAPRDVADIGTGCPPALGADCRWTSRMRLTFDNAGQDEELTDFPVMVALSEPRLDFADLQDAGEDLRFLDATATQVLPHEIEIWNEAARSVVWVRVPRIGANSTTDHVWVYYGHPDAPDAQDAGSVWSDGFELVWHLSGSFADSTSASNDGSNVGTTNAAGRLGRGRAFDGRGQYVDSDYDTELTTVTVEA